MRVLYVEDDPFDADLTRRELSKAGSSTVLDITPTLHEALYSLNHGDSYDLVLTDLRLSDGSGFELLSYIRQHQLHLAVVVITGQGDEETAVAALKAGADDYIVKRKDYLTNLDRTLSAAHRRYHQEIARRGHALHVLYIEQSLEDANATARHFAMHSKHIRLNIVASLPKVLELLESSDAKTVYDVVLLAFHGDPLGTLDILKEIRQLFYPGIPILLVTASGDEEVAAQALRLGASDYIGKSPGYLYKLPGLIENAYHLAQMHREQEASLASEKRFQALIENSADGMLLLDATGIILYSSPSTTRILGYQLDEYIGENILSFVHPDDQEYYATNLDYLVHRPGETNSGQVRYLNKDGSWRWLDFIVVNSLSEPAVNGLVVNFRDITERRRDEERIQRQLKRLNALRTIDMAITTSLDLRLILAILLENAVSQLGAQAADLLQYNPNTQILELVDGRGTCTYCQDSTGFSLGCGMADRVVSEKRTIRIPDIGEEFPEFLRGQDAYYIYYGTPLIAKGKVKGVLEICLKAPFEPDSEWLSFFETLAGQAAIAIDNTELFDGLQQANLDLIRSYDTTLEGWVRALDLRDKETEGHTQRVAAMTVRLAKELGIADDQLIHFRRGALLHDIGKIGIPDYVLHKPGALSEEEWSIVRKHPGFALNLLSPIPYLRPALDIPYCHHEKWDGTGYPRGLQGDQIPIAARIFAVIDIWDALRYDRPYRRRWDRQQILEHIESLSGSHLDPRVVDIFLQLIHKEEQYF